MASAGKVLVLVENLSVPFDRRVWQESLALRHAGYQVSVICPRMVDKKPFEMLEGIAVYRYPMPYTANRAIGYAWEYSWAMLWTFLYACYVFFRRGFKVIHACNPPDLFFLVAAPFRLLGVRFVFDQHDLSPETFESKYPNKGGLILRILRALEYGTYRSATAVISTNNSYRKIAIERGRLSPEQVFVVRSAPDLNKFSPLPPNAEWKRGRTYLAAYLGTMGAQDGLDYLLKAAKLISQDWGRQDIHFLLMGGGENLLVLKQMAESLGLTDVVEFTGRVSNEQVREVLSTADVCLAPDPINPLNTHCTMNKILEYMAMARPIVSYRLTESEYSAQQAAAYAKDNDIEDFAKKILELLDNEDRRREMGAFGSQRLKEQLSWEHSTRELLKTYDFVFQKK
ncbi:MAG: glycosyltransferase family 4 protein [Calditrichaeota bacterium]|nr:glycosyltransferase family 4 protein [Calditrichota bacterium]MCB9391089.1 glycosyltransferase family 4 protein [Calditrichota bacterium]